MSASEGRGGNVAFMLAKTASRVPERLAVVEPRRSTTYRELATLAASVARSLQVEGQDAGDRVVVLLDRGADAVASYFGVLAAGGLAVMLNSVLRPRQIEYALSQSGARLMLTSAEVLEHLHRDIHSDARVLTLESISVDPAPDLEPVGRADHDPAQVTYTSGSTGMPKGVVASHYNVWQAIETVAEYLGIDGNDRIAGLLPFSGVYGANQMLCAVSRGATLVVPRAALMNDVAAELRAAEVSVLAAVPPLWMQLLQAPRFTDAPIPSLRILQNAGGHLAPSAVQTLRRLQPQADLFLQYGMTEVFRSTFLPPDEVDRRPESMGRPMQGVEILVVGEDGTPCPVGEVGELVHSGPTVSQGYWNDPRRTSEVFRPHPLDSSLPAVVYSGDMVRRDEDGFLYFVGRRDRMIKTLGYRVGPDEVLDVLYASGEIREGVVAADLDTERGARVVAYVVLAEGGSVKSLKRYCRLELPRYMQPANIIPLAELPKSPNGKHDLISLRAMVAESRP